MSFVMEGRASDSAYVEMIWHGGAYSEYRPICPADTRWDLLLLRRGGQVTISVEGPLTRAKPKVHPEGTEWRVIKFKLGAFMPNLPVTHLLDGTVTLPEGSRKTFWLHGSTWEFPGVDDVEAFVARLVRAEVLVRDPLVHAVLNNQPPEVSARTVRRRFLHATGLTYKGIQQIERAQQAMALLQNGTPILDVTYQLGYADQPHLTRTLKRFTGQTPAQISRPIQLV
ncbi:MAG TPA: helix-turn-helix transcriptional regulator [Phototrophicaceae bacterium]|nr:helix-turn-helix transcriptional regulator [Phototrophicaceae bacterium]